MNSVIILFSNPGVPNEQTGFMHLQIHPLFLCQLWFHFVWYLVSSFCVANSFVFDVLDFLRCPQLGTRFYQTPCLCVNFGSIHAFQVSKCVTLLFLLSVVTSIVVDVLNFT